MTFPISGVGQLLGFDGMNVPGCTDETGLIYRKPRGRCRGHSLKSFPLMNPRTFLVLLTIAGTSLAAQPANAPAVPPAGAVMVRSEASELAAGFAAAFPSFGSRPVFLVYERAGKTTVIFPVRALEASGGVVLVRLENRSVHLINARDIVALTDEGPPRN